MNKIVENVYAKCPHCGHIERDLTEDNSEKVTTYDYTVYCSGKGCGEEYLYTPKR